MIVGIDPGKRGGIAILENGGFRTMKMPSDPLEVGKMVSGLVFIEKLNIRPDDMNFGKAARVQKMLADYERLKAGLEMNGVPYVMVHPMKWQTFLGVRESGLEKAERKRRYKDIARRAFPNNKVTLLNADALLILLFGMRIILEDRRWLKSNCPTEFDLPALIDEIRSCS